MTALDPSRHFAATQQFSRFRGEADIGVCVPIAESDANDPNATLGSRPDAFDLDQRGGDGLDID
jgi:hypothetical protein